MKISQLYSNKPDKFGPIKFNSRLNVVLAEIRLPENQEKDTHNLGKSTLGRMLDFCFLTTRRHDFFLFKHFDLFSEFVFFLEIELNESSYITIRRSVESASKVSFKRHSDRGQNFVDTGVDDWDHYELPFEKSVSLLDGILDWRTLKPWNFRKILGYQLRSQPDYQDVFQLSKFAGAHSEWKPFLAKILGFDAKLFSSHYEKEGLLEKRTAEALVVQNELGGSIFDISKIEGMLQLRQKDAEEKEIYLNDFDFRSQDKENTKKLVGEIDSEISDLNSRRYSLTQSKKKITDSIRDDKIIFDPGNAVEIFGQAGVLFRGQIKKDFEQLVAFNKAITEERSEYLKEERKDISVELSVINGRLNKLGKTRSKNLSFLSSTDAFEKYKEASSALVTLKTDIQFLEKQREFLRRLQELRTEMRKIEGERNELQAQIEKDVETKNSDKGSHFSTIRQYFSDIVEEVISRKALLDASTNQYGHLELKVTILAQSGIATSADAGFTYRKLLCVAFDLAVLRAHLDVDFPRFVFHDGIFESLDDRKKSNLLEIIRKYSDLGIQHIITLIDSDMPPSSDEDVDVFDSEEDIVLLLHDESDEGKLFRMPAW